MSGNEHSRDWRIYNEELVVGGKFHLDFEFVSNWNRELEEVNRNKRGGNTNSPSSS